MAPRLAVVVSQAPMRDARTADIEESIVAELIMVGGLDATLVGPLERIQSDSTDRLCLEGFTQDLALLSWMSVDEAAKCWSVLGLAGTVVPLSLDGTAVTGDVAMRGPATGRRVFYIQLTSASEPRQVCKQLRSRLDLMRVQPVAIQLSLSAPTKNTAAVKPSQAASPVQPVVRDGNSNGPKTSKVDSHAVVQPSSQGHSDSRGSTDEDWKSLDSLVDQLDALDL